MIKVHDMLGDTDYDFEFFFLFLLFGSQILRFPDWAWAKPGLGTAKVDLVGPGLDWAGPGPGLCLFHVFSIFPPLMKKPPICSVPWFLEASLVFF